jgi:Mrp family chromosome partitioning ATPase
MRVDDHGHAIGYKVLKRGTPVRSSDGVQVGTVRRVLDNAREHIFDGIVIDTPDGRRFVDAPEVARIFERAVVLTITAEDAKALPEQGSALSARMRSARSVRRAKRFGQSLRDRWDQR